MLEFFQLGKKKYNVLGYFNMEVENKAYKYFLQEPTFYNMTQQDICFNDYGCLCVDLLIKNSKLPLMKINSFEHGLSYHLYMIDTIAKTKLKKFEPMILIYHNCKQFDSDQFNFNICNSMSSMRAHADFENDFVSILYENVPKKKHFITESKPPF